MEIFFLNLIKSMFDSPYFNKLGVIAILIILLVIYIAIRKLINKISYIDIFQRSMHKGISVMNGQGKVYSMEQEKELRILMERENFTAKIK